MAAVVVPVSLCKSPKETWEAIVDKGVAITEMSMMKVFVKCVYGGAYIGFGGLLAATVAGGLAAAAAQNPTIQSWVFAALFPVNLMMIKLTGGLLYTGVALYIPAAIFEGKATWSQLPKLIIASWLGNLVGAAGFALLVTSIGMNVAGTAELAAHLTVKKCSQTFAAIVVKGVLCNWMVCMAIWLNTSASDVAGKLLGIWWPIMTFVATGFEHLPANQFTLTFGYLSGLSGVSVRDILINNFIGATIGNFIAGAFVVAAGYSYMFGRLGEARSAPADSSDEDPISDLESTLQGHAAMRAAQLTLQQGQAALRTAKVARPTGAVPKAPYAKDAWQPFAGA